MAISFGLSREKAAILLSIIGIASTLARVLIGWLSDQSWVDCLVINNCALILGGGATIMCPFCQTFPLLATYGFVFGCCIGECNLLAIYQSIKVYGRHTDLVHKFDTSVSHVLKDLFTNCDI